MYLHQYKYVFTYTTIENPIKTPTANTIPASVSISMHQLIYGDAFSANMEKPNKPYCDCGAGYRGDKCEFDLCNELINPCVNGNCTHSPDYPYRMECICDPDWTGLAYRFKNSIYDTILVSLRKNSTKLS